MRHSRPSPAGWRIISKNNSCSHPATHWRRRRLCCIVFAPANVWLLGADLCAGRNLYVVGETLEDSFCAELAGEEHHGMAFGVLANGQRRRRFLSSIVVGALWTAFGTGAAFGYSAVLFGLGALLVLRTRSGNRWDLNFKCFRMNFALLELYQAMIAATLLQRCCNTAAALLQRCCNEAAITLQGGCRA